MLATVAGLQERLGAGFRVVLKAHQSVHHLLVGRPDLGDVLISNDVPTNVLLGVTDHLITDFSSIFFDYLARDRPITFYVPDPGAYREERGAYFADAELPGAVVHDLDALAERIASDADPALDRRRAWAERFTPRSDGHAAERVVDAVFGSGAARAAETGGTRTKVLLYLGGMRSNGITSSALSLLRALDHDRLDVSVLIARPAGADRRGNQALVDPRVRQFVRQGGMNAGKVEMGWLKARERMRPGAGETATERRLYADEWRRLFGGARFDAVVDFSGYSRFWAQLLLHSPDARRSIWLHNEMAAEVNRSIGGRRRMRLPAVFSLYPRFDALVSVSAELSRLNRASVASGIPESAFLAARNPVDADRILAGAAVPVAELRELQIEEPPAWGASLAETGVVRFVTVGRLSPEKNHRRLLQAFAAVHADRPETRLVIVGSGHEREALAAEIQRLGLEGAATLTGAVQNPFAIMALADCFVLSSDHEGQPMVLLEAATLGMPIICTDFGSVRDALPTGAITVVASDAPSLADGMRGFLEGRVPPAEFDVNDYNRVVIGEAEAAILGRGAGRADGSSASSSSSIIASASASTATTSQAAAASSTTAPAAIPRIHHMTTSDRSRASSDHAGAGDPRTL
jgi:glycosyltransferase involved in cell wall biosynthesis